MLSSRNIAHVSPITENKLVIRGLWREWRWRGKMPRLRSAVVYARRDAPATANEPHVREGKTDDPIRSGVAGSG